MTQYGSCLSSAHELRFSFCPPPIALVLASVMLGLLSACDHKPGVKASISQLEKAFAAPAVPGQAAQAIPGQASRADANGYVQTALSAVRSNDYGTGIVMLKAAARAPGMAPDQFLAVQQAKNALLADLQNRARKGDASAQAALKSIE